MTTDTPAMDEKGLEALARAYDREDASQRGEPSPWDDGAEDATWRAERLACSKAGRDAYLAATARDGETVGEAGTMPGTDGFTMACFKAADVPVGSKLYLRASLKAAPEAEVVKALEWQDGEARTGFGSAYAVHRQADGAFVAVGCGSFVGGTR